MRMFSRLGTAALFLTACLSVTAQAAPTARSVLNGYADFAEAVYGNAAASAGKMQAAVDGFLAEPDAAKLATAQAAFGTVLITLRHGEGAGLGDGGSGAIAELLLGGAAADFSAAACSNEGCAGRRERLKATADAFTAQLEQKTKNWGKGGESRKVLGDEEAGKGLDRILAVLAPGAAALEKVPLSRAEAEALYQRQFGVASLYNGFYRRFSDGVSLKVASFGAYARSKSPDETRDLEQALTATTLAFEALRKQSAAPTITDEVLITRAREAAEAQAKAARLLREALMSDAPEASRGKRN